MKKVLLSTFGCILLATVSFSQCDFERIGFWTPTQATSLAVDGQNLYLNRGGNLIVADHRTTGELAIIGELALPGTIERIHPKGDRLWILSGDDGLFIVDIRDPTLPSLVGSIDTSGWASDLVVQDRYAYLADGIGGLLILDLWNIEHPVEVGRLTFSGAVQEVTVQDGLAFVALGEGGIGVADVANPRRSRTLGEHLTAHPVTQIEAINGTVFAVILDFGLRAYSSNPTGSLEEIGSLRWSPRLSEFEPATAAVVFDSDYAYFLSPTMLTLIDIKSPKSVLPVAWHHHDLRYSTEVAVYDSSIFVLGRTDYGSEMKTIIKLGRDDSELTQPPPFLASISSPSQPLDLGFRGDYAYVAQGAGGLGVVDNSDPLAPHFLRSIPTSFDLFDIKIQDGISYHTWNAAGTGLTVQAFDLSDPTYPRQLGPEGYNQTDLILYSNLLISGDLAFLINQWDVFGGEGPRQLSIFDLSNPASPSLVSASIPFGQAGLAMALVRDLLFTRNRDGTGLKVFDVSDPSQIEEIATHLSDHRIVQFKSMGDLLLASSDFKLIILDISHPYHPSIVAVVDTPDLELAESANQTAHFFGRGYWTLDLSDPQHPGEIINRSVGFNIETITANQGNTYIVGWGTGSFLLNPNYRADDYLPLWERARYEVPWSMKPYSLIGVGGDTAVLTAEESSSYWLADLSELPSIRRHGPFSLAQSPIEDIVINHSFLYIFGADQPQIVDISNPSAPLVLGTIETSISEPEGIASNEHFLLIGDNASAEIELFGLLDPANPKSLGLFDLSDSSGRIRGAVIEGELLLHNTYEGLHLWDLSDPDGGLSHSFLESHDLDGSISADFPYIYISSWDFNNEPRIEVVDISDSGNPQRVASVETESGTTDTLLVNSLLLQKIPTPGYFSPSSTRIYSLQDPLSPARIGANQARVNSFFNFKSQGNRLVIQDFTNSLALFNLECGTCLAGEDTLCLGEDNQFKTSLRWWGASRGQGGVAAAAQQSPQSGLFSWEDPENPEMIVKVLDGTDLNGAHWVFAAGATDVGYTLSVEDKVNGELREYRNELGTPACAVTDTGAFPVDTSQQAPTALARRSHNTTAATELLLHDTRFRLSLEWRGETGATKSAFAIPHSDKGGFFYWTNPDNLEMVVKVLDGREVNGHFWVFAATSSDVEFRLRVEDTETSQVKDYFNPLGEAACSVRDTDGF